MPFPSEIIGRRGDSNNVTEIPPSDSKQKGAPEAYEPEPPSCFQWFWGSSKKNKRGDFHPLAG